MGIYFHLNISLHNIDNIEICRGKYYRDIIGQIVAYLNQIEQLGVDTFLENYKAAVIVQKEELSIMCDKLAAELQDHEDEEKGKMLNRMRAKIETLIGLLFLLTVNMNAGLDNHQYIDAYTECENIISNITTNDAE